eukprot:TRINITY_DN4317_c0_g2_i2.p1 TRINITY_DN4317_c0_g2~~TRINITY_DN4317_c0_g2_i2.p1  ORF type:complete len:466 (+),score=129.32 TRINITY_DN4317_c0_g2_i2:149-1546(+)
MAERYIKKDRLSKGEASKLYLAFDLEEKRECMMRVLDIADMGVEDYEKNVKTLKELCKLRHENIIAYQNCVLDKNQRDCAIVIERFEGRSLAEVVQECKDQKKKIPEEKIVDYLRGIVKGLKYLHDNEVVHQKLAPENILVDDNNNLKLLDYGIFKIVKNIHSSGYIDTKNYACMSPEMLKGNKFDESSDIWSLGCIVYELCTLSPPYSGQSPEMQVKAIEREECNLEKISAEYSQGLKDFIEAMLNRDRYLRPSIEEVFTTVRDMKRDASNSKIRRRAKKEMINKKSYMLLYSIIGLVAAALIWGLFIHFKPDKDLHICDDYAIDPYQTKVYSQNEFYKGDLLNGTRNGKGIQYVDGKIEYCGEWEDDKRHGYGILFADGKMVYNGTWEKGERQGYDKQIFEDNSVYESHRGHEAGRNYEKEGEEIHASTNGTQPEGNRANSKPARAPKVKRKKKNRKRSTRGT